MHRALIISLCALASAGSASAQDIVVTAPSARPYDAVRLSDPDLAKLRGGINLPNGLQVSIGIDIQTWVNNVLVLHTVYASDGLAAGVHVYSDGSTAPKIAPATVTVTSPGTQALPTVMVTRSPAQTTITPGDTTAGTTVNLVEGDPGTWLTGVNQTLVPVVNNGAPVAGPDGTYSLSSDKNGSVVTLSADDLQIRHLIGQATGTAVANSADNRDIQTVSSVNVDLGGAAPLTALSGFLVADRLALDAMASR